VSNFLASGTDHASRSSLFPARLDAGGENGRQPSASAALPFMSLYNRPDADIFEKFHLHRRCFEETYLHYAGNFMRDMLRIG
jgi:hypothetical protein